MANNEGTSVDIQDSENAATMESVTEVIQSALTSANVSSIFIPPVPDRTWSEYFSQSYYEARAHEIVISVVKEAFENTNSAITDAQDGALQLVHRGEPTLDPVILMRSAETASRNIKTAKSASAYASHLTEAIVNMLENSKPRDVLGLNLDGTYGNIEFRDRWATDQVLIGLVAAPVSASYRLFCLLVEVAELALLEALVNSLASGAELDDLLHDEYVEATAELALMARICLADSEASDFTIAKAHGPRISPFCGDPARELWTKAQQCLEISKRAITTVNIIKDAGLIVDSAAHASAIQQVFDSTIDYRNTLQSDHSQCVRQMERTGDTSMSADPINNEMRGIRRPVLTEKDNSLDKLIAARLDYCPSTLDIRRFEANVGEYIHSLLEDLRSLERMTADLSPTCPRFRFSTEARENFVNFVYSISRGTPAPDFINRMVLASICKELETVTYNIGDAKSLIRLLIEVSIAGKLRPYMDKGNATVAIQKGIIYAEFERMQLAELFRRVLGIGVASSLPDDVFSAFDRELLVNAVQTLIGNPLLGSNISENYDLEAVERLKEVLVEVDTSNNSKVDVLLAVRRIENHDGIAAIAQIAEEALPVVMRLSQHFNQQPDETSNTMRDELTQLYKALIAAADFNE
jgi:hypothetical protein